MVSRFPSTGFNILQPSLFSHLQLRQVLTAYSEGVLRKNWKDYAIESSANQTVFCVIERGQGQPMAVIYSISCCRSAKKAGENFYRVFDGERQICRTNNFLEALEVFRRCGLPGQKKLKPIR